MSYTLITFLFTCTLIGAHFVSPYLKEIKTLKPYIITSFASGLTVAYVFLHMLPSLVESHAHIHTLLLKTEHMGPFKDLIVFITALIGFDVFYFTDRYVTNELQSEQTSDSFKLHLTLYCIYNFLITYTLKLEDEAALTNAILFVIAIGLHFILSDNFFKRHYPKRFNWHAKVILAVALLIGWLSSFIFYPGQLFIPALMTAALSGAVLYNAFTEEITLTRQTSITAFFIGTAIMGTLLAIQLV